MPHDLFRARPRVALVLAGFMASLLSAVVTPAATAAPGDSVALYFSAPFVTGSHVTTGALTETFNGLTPEACRGAWAVGTVSGSGCYVNTSAATSAGDSEPAIGVPLSAIASTWNGTGNETMNITATFANPVKYVGLWWLMGSTGNTVKFLDASDNVIATMTTSDIMTFLGISYAQVSNADTGTLPRVDGGTHLRKHYFKSPSTYTGTVSNPVNDYLPTYANEPWVYLNLFVSGSTQVTKVNLSGPNFEFDNLTVSTAESGPRGDMVLVSNVLGTPPAAQVIAWNPTNTTAPTGGTSLAPNALATVTSPVTGGGAITYSVANAGATGCTVDSTTGVISYTAAGSCVVRATAAAVSGYFAATKDVMFTIPVTPSFTVTTQTTGTGSGSASGGGSYLQGATVTVTATAAAGSTFTGWTCSPNASLNTTSAVLSFTVAANQACSADFVPTPLPVPDPQQTSTISATPERCVPGSAYVISGSFDRPITAVTVNGQTLAGSAWTQNANSITLRLPSGLAATTEIQMYNGAVPLLRKVQCDAAAVTPNPIPTPTSTPTPTPQPSVAPKRAKVAFTVYFGESSAALSRTAKSTIARYAAKVDGATDIAITAVGFVRPTAKRANDASLSLARAKAVAAEFARLGVAASVLVSGNGRSAIEGPLGRRTEVTIVYMK